MPVYLNYEQKQGQFLSIRILIQIKPFVYYYLYSDN